MGSCCSKNQVKSEKESKAHHQRGSTLVSYDLNKAEDIKRLISDLENNFLKAPKMKTRRLKRF